MTLVEHVYIVEGQVLQRMWIIKLQDREAVTQRMIIVRERVCTATVLKVIMTTQELRPQVMKANGRLTIGQSNDIIIELVTPLRGRTMYAMPG